MTAGVGVPVFFNLASGRVAMFQWMAPQKKLDSGLKKKKDMMFEGGVRWGRSRRD